MGVFLLRVALVLQRVCRPVTGLLELLPKVLKTSGKRAAHPARWLHHCSRLFLPQTLHDFACIPKFNNLVTSYYFQQIYMYISCVGKALTRAKSCMLISLLMHTKVGAGVGLSLWSSQHECAISKMNRDKGKTSTVSGR